MAVTVELWAMVMRRLMHKTIDLNLRVSVSAWYSQSVHSTV